ncbi:hypothetical protein EXW17_13790 [Enterococcus faecium]|nr:hypothetical protein [Enterococcus faecium]
MFLWLKTLYRKRAVTWPFIFYTIIWTLSISIAKKVEILYLPLTLASLANVVSILIDNKLR